MTQRVNWRQVFAEVGILFAGALLALGADAWWDERQERREEAAYIASIRDDLAANAVALDELEMRYRQIMAADSALLAHLQGTGTELEGDSLLYVTLRAFTMHYFRPTLGTYHDMIGSGSLRLIRDRDIRDGLASFAEDVEVLQGAINLLLERWMSIEEPFMIEHLPVTVIFDGYPRGIGEAAGIWTDLAPLEMSPPPDVSGEIPRTREFANMIGLRMVLVWDVLFWTEFVRERLEAVTEAVG
jgi:hypothetical protein